MVDRAMCSSMIAAELSVVTCDSLRLLRDLVNYAVPGEVQHTLQNQHPSSRSSRLKGDADTEVSCAIERRNSGATRMVSQISIWTFHPKLNGRRWELCRKTISFLDSHVVRAYMDLASQNAFKRAHEKIPQHCGLTRHIDRC